MANYLVTDLDLESIADAIRAASGGSSQLAFPSEFISEIGKISSGSGGVTATGEVTLAEKATVPAAGSSATFPGLKLDFQPDFFWIAMTRSSWDSITTPSGTNFYKAMVIKKPYMPPYKIASNVSQDSYNGDYFTIVCANVIASTDVSSNGTALNGVTAVPATHQPYWNFDSNGYFNFSRYSSSSTAGFPPGTYRYFAVKADGGGEWTRPAGWPDLSAMDYSSEVVYMTYSADESNGFCFFAFRTSTGNYSVEIGEIVNGNFVADSTYTLGSNSNCQHYFGSSAGGYKVIRVKALTGTITGFSFSKNNPFTADGVSKFGTAQGLLEFYASLGTLTNNDGFFNGARFVQHIHLGKVKLPSSLQRMFSDCRMLSKIDAASWDTSAVQNMSYMFTSCGLKHADISGWDTSSLTNITDMFYSSSFVELDLNNWDVSRCTTFHYLFEACGQLRKLEVGKWDTSSVTSFVETFYNAGRLEQIDVSKWDTGSVTSMTSTFYGCYCLQALDLSDWDFTKVTSTQTFLNNAQSIGSITFPSTLKTIGARAFDNTRNLFEFHFRSQTPPTLVNTNAFVNMTDGDGKKIYVPYSEDHSILNAYKTETNWSTYASYIYEEAAP